MDERTTLSDEEIITVGREDEVRGELADADMDDTDSDADDTDADSDDTDA